MIVLRPALRGVTYGSIHEGHLEIGKWWENGGLVKIYGPVDLAKLDEIAKACKAQKDGAA